MANARTQWGADDSASLLALEPPSTPAAQRSSQLVEQCRTELANARQRLEQCRAQVDRARRMRNPLLPTRCVCVDR